jgi:predicted dehydrogenase
MSVISIAVIGLGLIGPRHAAIVSKSPDTNLIAIVDPLPKAIDTAREFSTSYYKSIAELLSSPQKPDAAIVCTPNHMHVAMTKELTAAGIHVLVEKPLSTDIPSGISLLHHLSSLSVKVLVGHHRRFNPYMVKTFSTVTSGSLGRIIGINGMWALSKSDAYFNAPMEWHRGADAGVILINLVHEVDLLHYLFGPITRVYAEKSISQRGHVAEEGAAITLRFKSGVVGSFLITDNTPSPYNFEAGTGENPQIPKSGQSFYRIMGSEASLSVPDMTKWSYAGEKSWHEQMKEERLDVVDDVPFKLQLDHFVRVIRGVEEPSCSVEEGLRAIVVCEAIKKSMESGMPIAIDEQVA